MYQPNYERIAQKLVRDSIRVQPGQQVIIDTRSDAVLYAELIAAEVCRAGGVPTLQLHSDDLKHGQLVLSPLDQLSLPETPQVAAIMASDHFVTLGLFDTEPHRFRDIVPERQQAAAVRGHARRLAMFSEERAGTWLATDYPTRQMAQGYHVAWERLFEMYWRAMDIDYVALHERVTAVAGWFERCQTMHLTTPQGTDLRLRRGERRIFFDDGVVRGTGNLPGGEVFFAPLEESVEGRLVYDIGFHQGERIRELELHFDGGTFTPVGAAEGFDTFLRQWEIASGDKNRLGEMGVGLNPEVHLPIGFHATDDKAFGVLHLSLGRNTLTGGINQSSMRWAMFVLQPTLYLDDTLFLERGRFVVPGLML